MIITMICPQCGESFDGEVCPACGAQASRESASLRDEKAPRGRLFRALVITLGALAVISAGLGFAAQRWGEPYGLQIGAASQDEIYETLIPSGHYLVGVDLPAGVYRLVAESGAGRLTTSSGVVDAELVADGGADTLRGYEDVPLRDGDILTVAGMTLRLTGRPTGTVSARSDNPATQKVRLAAAEESKTYVAGRDFPAGTYVITVDKGSGSVRSDSESGGIDLLMAAKDGNGAVSEFRNAALPEGASLTLTGVELLLTPSK